MRHRGNVDLPANAAPATAFPSLAVTSEEPDLAFRPSLTLADVREFQALLRSECRVEMDEAEAWNRATELLNLVRMMLGRIPEDRGSPGVRTSSSLPSSSPEGRERLG